MRVLVGCEFSGVVREAFAALGHDAWSCDLLPTERPGQHIQGDVRKVVRWGWDLAVIHWPCTLLANSGVRWLYGGKGREVDAVRWAKMEESARTFRELYDAPVPRLAMENPVMHGHALRIVGVRPTQVVQPYWFGEPYQKATCLWLRGLPKLLPTKMVAERRQACWLEPPGPERWKNRSRTYEGVARAMADAWGGERAQVGLFAEEAA